MLAPGKSRRPHASRRGPSSMWQHQIPRAATLTSMCVCNGLNASSCAPCEFALQVTEHKCAGHGGHLRVTGVARTLPHHSRPCCRPAAAARSMLRGTTRMSDATVIERAETNRDTGMSTPAATTATGQPCLRHGVKENAVRPPAVLVHTTRPLVWTSKTLTQIANVVGMTIGTTDGTTGSPTMIATRATSMPGQRRGIGPGAAVSCTRVAARGVAACPRSQKPFRTRTQRCNACELQAAGNPPGVLGTPSCHPSIGMAGPLHSYRHLWTHMTGSDCAGPAIFPCHDQGYKGDRAR